MAELTYKQRKALPKSSFVFPKERAFPIKDKAHARAALQMAAGARSGKPQSSERRAKIKAAVHKKFPSIGIAGLSKPGKDKR